MCTRNMWWSQVNGEKKCWTCLINRIWWMFISAVSTYFYKHEEAFFSEYIFHYSRTKSDKKIQKWQKWQENGFCLKILQELSLFENFRKMKMQINWKWKMFYCSILELVRLGYQNSRLRILSWNIRIPSKFG